MTVPWLGNCGHHDETWCPRCVERMGADWEQMRNALHAIMAITNKMEGSDWAEIDEARAIATKAIVTTSLSPPFG